MGWGKGIEPSTSWTTIKCSNQLSYPHHGRKSAISIIPQILELLKNTEVNYSPHHGTEHHCQRQQADQWQH